MTAVFLHGCKKDEMPTVSITGTVRDANGSPLSDALIKVLNQPASFQTLTDQSGNYKLTDLPFDDYYTVTSSKSGYHDGEKTVKFGKGEREKQADFILQDVQPYLSLSQKTFNLDNNAHGKNGYGVAVLREESGGLSRFKVIDSANNDELIIYYPVLAPEIPPALTSVTHDGKKILMTHNYGAPRIQILDTQTHELTEQDLQLAGLMSKIRPSRVSNKIFVGGLYTQFVFDLETASQAGSPSYLSLVGEESCDFTYNPSNDTEVYCMIPDLKQFEVLDYSQGKTLYSCKVPQDLKNLTATTDRKRIIVSRGNELFLINSDTFK